MFEEQNFDHSERTVDPSLQQHCRVEEIKDIYFLGIDLNRTPPESPILKLNKRSCDDMDSHIAKKKKTSEELKETSLSPTIEHKYSPCQKNKENGTKSKKTKANPLSPYGGGSMRNLRSLTKQKPHYFILNRENGTITSSPFNIGIPSRHIKGLSHPLSPTSPVHIKGNRLDRMRMPPPSPTASMNMGSLSSPFRSPAPKERFSLTSPLLRRLPSTPKFSPVVPSLFSESPTIGDEWKIGEYYFHSEDSSENDDKEEERNYKYWCRRENLLKILEKQALIDADEIFGPPYNVCDLEKIFHKSKPHYNRTDRSSGNWSPQSSPI